MQTRTASRCREGLVALRKALPLSFHGRTIAQRAIDASHHVRHFGHFGRYCRLTTPRAAANSSLIQYGVSSKNSGIQFVQISRLATIVPGDSASAFVQDSGNATNEEPARLAAVQNEEEGIHIDDNPQASTAFGCEPITDTTEARPHVQYLRQVADEVDIVKRPGKNDLQGNGNETDETFRHPRRILAIYIRSILIPKAVGSDFSAEEAILRAKYAKSPLSKRYDWNDLEAWANIVTSRSSEKATAELLHLAESTANPADILTNKAPVFLLTVLLRRGSLTTKAFKMLLLQTWNMLGNVYDVQLVERSLKESIEERTLNRVRLPPYTQRGKGNYPSTDLTTAATLHYHLLRHARGHWPEIIPRIVSGFISLSGGFTQQEDLKHAHMRKLTEIFNTMLHVIAKPSKNEPFQNINFAQNAQMKLLDHMGQFQPALPVNHMGYRAVISVQLRQRKTDRERDWASLQSKSWPPWKEDKYGLDADKGVEYGTSRARRAIIRSVEDGYAPQEWEKAASILAGWDTDNSPTIQTRSAPPSLESPGAEIPENDLDVDDQNAKDERDGPLIWATRVRATRTLDEAWACFQSYSEVSEWDHLVWFEMYKKLVNARVGSKLSHASESGVGKTSVQTQLHPGDSLKVWPTSENPRERPYLREPIPSEYAFVNDFLRRGLRLTPHSLIFAIRYAENLRIGFRLLQSSTLDKDALSMLFGQREVSSAVLQQHVNPMIVNNLVKLMCRPGNRSSHPSAAVIQLPHDDKSLSVDIPRHLLRHAYSLLLACNIDDGMTWFSLLEKAVQKAGLDEINMHIRDFQRDQEQRRRGPRHHSRLLPLTEFLSVAVSWNVRVYFREFLYLCQQLHTPLESVRRLSDHEPRRLEDLQKHIDLMKILFRDVTNGEEGKALSMHFKTESPQVFLFEPPPLPRTNKENHENVADEPEDLLTPLRLVNTPRPVHLHGFMRLLSLSKELHDVLDLLRWMSHFAPELNAKIGGHRNADVQMRRTLICARLALEDSQTGIEAGSSGAPADYSATHDPIADEGGATQAELSKAAQESPLDEARRIVGEHGEWGGWPSDEECNEYQQRSAQIYDSTVH